MLSRGYSPRPPISSDLNEILHGGWSSRGSSKIRISSNRPSDFGALGVEFCHFFTDLAFGLYKIVISQQIKEVIANGHEKLNNLMTAQTP